MSNESDLPASSPSEGSDHQQTTSSSAPKINRRACRNCHNAHKKCDGSEDKNCSRCIKRAERCIFDDRRKRGPRKKKNRRQDSATPTSLNQQTPSTVQSSATPTPLNQQTPTSLNQQTNQTKQPGQTNQTNSLNTSHEPNSSAESTEEGPLRKRRRKMKEAMEASSKSESNSSIQTQPNTISVRVLLCVTGSVAAVKAPFLVKELLDTNLVLKDKHDNEWTLKFDVRVVLTRSATHFVSSKQIRERLNSNYPEIECYDDELEWRQWKQIGDEVLHIELRRWADLLLVAPLSANTLAKMATGLCDNLVTCVSRAWDYSLKPAIVCPAMNTMMWNNFFTMTQLDTLKNILGVHIVNPVHKRLACGDEGIGALAPVETIIEHVVSIAIDRIMQDRIREKGGGTLILSPSQLLNTATTNLAQLFSSSATPNTATFSHYMNQRANMENIPLATPLPSQQLYPMMIPTQSNPTNIPTMGALPAEYIIQHGRPYIHVYDNHDIQGRTSIPPKETSTSTHIENSSTPPSERALPDESSEQ